jgi:hypothetical protein
MNTGEGLVKYIKENYPKVIFDKVNLSNASNHKKALGFVITDNKIIIGYISRNGELCKLIEPIDLSNISHENFINLVKKIPIVEGFNESDKERLVSILDKDVLVNKVNNDQVLEFNELKKEKEELEDKYNKSQVESDNIESKYKALDIEYKILVDLSNNDKVNMVLVRNKQEESINKIKLEYENKIKEIESTNKLCKDKLIHEKDLIVDSIRVYKERLDNYINESLNKNKSDGENYKLMESTISKLSMEKNEIEKRLDDLSKREEERLKELENNESNITDFSYQMNEKEVEINKLNETINIIRDELRNIQEKFSKVEIENKILYNFKTNCLEQILLEKETIIRQIKDYNDKWISWSESNKFNIVDYKKKLNIELSKVFNKLRDILRHKDEYIKDLDIDKKSKIQLVSKLENNINEIKRELTNVTNKQLESIKLKQEHDSDSDSDSDSDNLSNFNRLLTDKDSEIKDLKNELHKVQSLLGQNNTIPLKKVDYDNCYNLLQKFIGVNNMFYRKKEIINILDNIIFNESKMSVFVNLNETIKNNIRKKYTNVRDEINKHIDFLNLAKYVNSPIIQLFKSKSTIKGIPDNFCTDLEHISEYWDDNIDIYRQQDRILTNIYEDLSGAVRVYIKIKPLIGIEKKNGVSAVQVDTVQNIKQKRVVVDCSLSKNLEMSRSIKKETYGDFYGIFDDTFSNLDVYTGIEGSKTTNNFKINKADIIEASDTVSPGLYSTFKQVEDGYSVVIFGYGLSGSGKTYSILGQNGTPGLIHYGLSNLEDVENIKIKNIFEQYIDHFSSTLNSISGKIHNLVGKIPQLSSDSIKITVDETVEFGNVLPQELNLSNVTVENLFMLTSVLEKYRISLGRVKKTPNNQVSSRSHLYIVFQVKFRAKDGYPAKTGYITIVDTAGRESPMDIYNLFISTSGRYKTNLTTILGPTGGPSVVSNYLKDEYRDMYNPVDVFNILKEGMYINETINHLVYFFNKKNYRDTKIVMQKGLDNYSNNKYYVNPKDEEKRIKANNNALTIPIMKYLDSLSNKATDDEDFRPTKFITLICIRKDEEYCNQIFDSMAFGMQIKSS